MRESRPYLGERPCVWVVDDSPLEAEVAKRALGAAYDVRVLDDGSAALEHLSQGKRPDCMVLDWQMPGVSGLEVCRYLRASDTTRALPVLMLTVQHQTSDLVEALAAGADDYVAKPFAGAELAARVAAMIRTKRLRERAEVAEREVRELLESLPDPLVTIDRSGKLSMINAAARTMLAAVSDAPLGCRITELVPEFPLAAATSGHRAPEMVDVKIGDRTFAPALRTLGSDRDGITISLRDVTDRRRAEARRLDFYSIIAHDIRAPLGVVTLKTDMLLRGRHGELTPEATREINGMKGRIKELLEMVDDFLDLARLEGTTLQIERTPVDLVALIGDVLADFAHVAEAKGVLLAFEPCERSTVSGDRRRLQQVITNLLSNAIKFTNASGTVTVRCGRKADDVVLEVEDTGKGIAESVLPSLFQRYARALDTAHPIAGTGLGLMIVREIVEAHQGEAQARSTLGVGSTFTIRLPAA